MKWRWIYIGGILLFLLMSQANAFDEMWGDIRSISEEIKEINKQPNSVYFPNIESNMDEDLAMEIIHFAGYAPKLDAISPALSPFVINDLNQTIYPISPYDKDGEALEFLCLIDTDGSSTPTTADTNCSEGNQAWTAPYADMKCTLTVAGDTCISFPCTEFAICTVYDDTSYADEARIIGYAVYDNNLHVDINSPGRIAGEQRSTALDGNIVIDFNVFAEIEHDPLANIYNSSVAGSFEDTIFADMNIQLDQNDTWGGYWKFDECTGTTAYDETDNDVDGAIKDANWTVEAIGGCALDFERNNWGTGNFGEHVELGADADIDLAGETIWSMGAWIKMESDSTAALPGQVILKIGAFQAMLYFTNQDGDDLNRNAGVAILDNGSAWALATTEDIDLNKWYLMVGTYDGSTLTLSMNAGEDFNSVETSIIPNTNPFTARDWIGANRWLDLTFGELGNWFYDGQIDEVFLIKGYALTEDDIQDLYQYGCAGRTDYCCGDYLSINSKVTSCQYDWNSMTVNDGNYFIDINAYDQHDHNAVGSSKNIFTVDNNPPAISVNLDGDFTAPYNDFNANNLTCLLADLNDFLAIPYDYESYEAVWPFDEGTGTTVSSVGDVNHDLEFVLIVEGGYTFYPEWSETSKYGTSILFDGWGGFVANENYASSLIGDISGFDVNENFSVGAWVNLPLSFPSENRRYTVISTAPSPNIDGWTIWIEGDTNTLRFYGRGGGIDVDDDTTPLTANEWTHIAVTISEDDNNVTVKLFVNGIKVKEGDGNILMSTAENIFIGAEAGLQYGYNGYIDEPFFINTELSESAIKIIYEQYFPRRCKWDEEDVNLSTMNSYCTVEDASTGTRDMQCCFGELTNGTYTRYYGCEDTAGNFGISSITFEVGCWYDESTSWDVNTLCIVQDNNINIEQNVDVWEAGTLRIITAYVSAVEFIIRQVGGIIEWFSGGYIEARK